MQDPADHHDHVGTGDDRHGSHRVADERDGRGRVPGLALAAGVVVLGLPVGLLWRVLAPRAQLVRTAAGIDYANSETKAFITADAYLFLLCLATGVLAGVAVWRLARSRGLVTLFGLVLGAAAAAYLAWRVGVHGTSRSAVLAAARAGRLPARFDLPLQLHTRTVLLALPGAAALTWATSVFRSPVPPRPVPLPVADTDDTDPAQQPGPALSPG